MKVPHRKFFIGKEWTEEILSKELLKKDSELAELYCKISIAFEIRNKINERLFELKKEKGNVSTD
jgi:hypothetical protein